MCHQMMAKGKKDLDTMLDAANAVQIKFIDRKPP
jgi:hypothetical protein